MGPSAWHMVWMFRSYFENTAFEDRDTAEVLKQVDETYVAAHDPANGIF